MCPSKASLHVKFEKLCSVRFGTIDSRCRDMLYWKRTGPKAKEKEKELHSTAHTPYSCPSTVLAIVFCLLLAYRLLAHLSTSSLGSLMTSSYRVLATPPGHIVCTVDK